MRDAQRGDRDRERERESSEPQPPFKPSAIHASQPPTSPTIAFLPLKLPPLPGARVLVVIKATTAIMMIIMHGKDMSNFVK